MNLLIILKVALRSLRRTLLRSGLTALGIIIGVAAVITMVSLANGARAQFEEIFASLDSNQLTFVAMPPRAPGNFGRMMRGGLPPGDGLKVEDYQALRREVTGIASASVLLETPVGQVKANGLAKEARVMGVDVQGLEVNSRHLTSGAGFGETDVQTAATVCLISEFLAQTLMPGVDPVGRLLRIKDIPFTVIGVMADRKMPAMMGSMPGFGDTSVYLPYTSVLRRLNPQAQVTIALKGVDPAGLERLQQQASDVLESRRGKRKAEFTAGNVAEQLKAVKKGGETMTLLLAAIGGISLIVGGIGIMNIMLVSVKERTREIGIRLAIGTRGRDVMGQFLIESVILSVLGGVIGILLGVGASYLIAHLNGWHARVTLGSVLGAFLCSAAIGVFFGFYPARQAAQLDPIEALRTE